MKTNSDPERNDPLLEAVLRDEAWDLVNTAWKAEALGKFRARHRIRRLARWAGSLAALAVVAAAGVYWIGQRPASLRPGPVSQNPPSKPTGVSRLLTDQELISAFPRGSCFIAEIDGKKELVFLDAEARRTFLARQPAPAN